MNMISVSLSLYVHMLRTYVFLTQNIAGYTSWHHKKVGDTVFTYYLEQLLLYFVSYKNALEEQKLYLHMLQVQNTKGETGFVAGQDAVIQAEATADAPGS